MHSDLICSRKIWNCQALGTHYDRSWSNVDAFQFFATLVLTCFWSDVQRSFKTKRPLSPSHTNVWHFIAGCCRKIRGYCFGNSIFIRTFLRFSRQSSRRILSKAALIRVFQTLDSKVVAIYFGAQFCQPCQQFKPNLLAVRFRLRVCSGSFCKFYQCFVGL